MIVKTLGVKDSGAGGRMIAYVLRDNAVLRQKDGTPYQIRHNVFGSIEEIERQFREVEARRLHQRVNANRFLHTILSLSEQDREKVTPEILMRLSQEYIALLNKDALYYGSIHMHDNPHAHIIVSGCDLHGKSTRLDRKAFERLKQDLEAFQEREYPELLGSIVKHGKREKEADQDSSVFPSGAKSHKDELKQILTASFELAHNRDEFFALLSEENELKTYERGGKAAGVEQGGINYRFSTLGIDLSELDTRQERLKELEALRSEGEQTLEQNHTEDEQTIQRINELKELRNLEF